MNSVPIIHEDDHLLVVNKPCGVLVIPGRGEKNVPSNKPAQAAAAESLVEKLSREAGRKLFVVHRLDRDASGLLVFAKDAETHRALSMAFEHRDVEKIYLAAVQGDVKNDGVIDKPIRQFGSGRMGVDPRGKPSVTRYRVKEQLHSATLLEVSPESGRRHQIRVHLYSLGHPILGDNLYGHAKTAAPRLMLHAWKLSLPDPDGGTLALQAEPGDDFQSALAGLR